MVWLYYCPHPNHLAAIISICSGRVYDGRKEPGISLSHVGAGLSLRMPYAAVSHNSEYLGLSHKIWWC